MQFDQLKRREFITLLGGAAAAWPMTARAQQPYPSRPVRIIVGFAPGQAIDIVTRIIGQWVSERLGQQFIIENRPGAGGNIATETVVRAPPDGYTLLAIGSNNMINATLYEKLNYNFIRDIAPVASIYRVSQVMEMNPSFPAKTVPEFIAHAKAHPGEISFASAGNGSVAHVTGRRAARFGVSPTTARSRNAPSRLRSPTTTNPLAMPMRTASNSPARVSSWATAAMISSPARTVRSASSSCARG